MNRLRSYRYMEGLNQEELGHMLGLSPQMVSAVESGRRAFHADLGKIGYRPDRLELPSMSEPLHRHRASTKVTDKNRSRELLRLGGEVFTELRDRTPKVPQLELERLPPPATVDDLEELAIEVRCALRHEAEGPISNLTTAVERAGVCLIPIVGLKGIDGLSAWVKDVPVIGLSPTVPGDRFRLTLAHELAHLLFHRKAGEHTESEANRFAGALLFPLEEFDAAMPARPTLRDFVSLKSVWGVSIAAMVYRAHELEYIDDKRYRALQIQMSKWRRVEPGLFDAAHGTLLPRLVEVNGGTEGVAEELGVKSEHVAELVDWSHLRVA